MMKRLYSPSAGSCYVKGLHAEMPADVIEISADLFDRIIGNPVLGKVRVHDDAGVPCLIDPPVDTHGAEAAERVWRDDQVGTTEWVVTRHRDELDMQLATTLLPEQFAALLQYRQALRDWPQAALFPNAEHRPLPPHWLAQLSL